MYSERCTMYWQENNGMEFDLHQDCSRLLGLVFLIASILCSIILAIPVCKPDPVAARSDQPPRYSEAPTKSKLQEVGDSILATGTPLVIYLIQTAISINPSAISSVSKPFTLAPVSQPLFSCIYRFPTSSNQDQCALLHFSCLKNLCFQSPIRSRGSTHYARVGTTH